MFTGIQILEPEIFEYIPRRVFSHSTTDVYPKAIADGRTVAAHVAHGNWFELSTLARYLEISIQMLHETGQENSFGKDCSISEAAQLNETIIWDNVQVHAGAHLRRVVVADDVVIPAGEVIQDCVVVPASLVRDKPRPEKALSGDFQGNNFVVPVVR